jgi:hypothetical protein
MAPSPILATNSPYGSISQGGIPTSSAISATGLSVACRAISSALGIGMSIFLRPAKWPPEAHVSAVQ